MEEFQLISEEETVGTEHHHSATPDQLPDPTPTATNPVKGDADSERLWRKNATKKTSDVLWPQTTTPNPMKPPIIFRELEDGDQGQRHRDGAVGTDQSAGPLRDKRRLLFHRSNEGTITREKEERWMENQSNRDARDRQVHHAAARMAPPWLPVQTNRTVNRGGADADRDVTTPRSCYFYSRCINNVGTNF